MDSTFDRVVRALSAPEAYGVPVGEVVIHQTHISVVFLAGERAYKIKKPLQLGFLDYGTLERRRQMCEQEVLLNRRLCPAMYLGVVPITDDPGGIRVHGGGPVLEYAVQMRRLPERRMMDQLLGEGGVTEGMVEALAERIVEFHAGAEGGESVARHGSFDAVQRLWDENLDQLGPFIGQTLTGFQDGLLRATGQAWLTRLRPALELRRAQGRVRDVHGDLRTSAVCFTDPIQIFDCVEFSDALRCSDVASEVAFLAMDLELRGRPELAQGFVSGYVRRSHDAGLKAVLPFYKCYRACVRGKVESLRASQGEVDPADRAQARQLAVRGFQLACRYARQDPPPVLLLLAGLSGTGKSTLAAALERAGSWTVLASDRVRKALAGIPPDQHRPAPYGQGIYAQAMTEQTYAELMARAEPLLRAGRSVVLDATFLHSGERKLALRLAEEGGAIALAVILTAPEETIRDRMKRRAQQRGSASDADWTIYQAQKGLWEPWAQDAWHCAEIPCEGGVDEGLARVRRFLSERLEA